MPIQYGLMALEQNAKGNAAMGASGNRSAEVAPKCYGKLLLALTRGGGSASAGGDDPQAQGIEPDKAVGILLIVSTGVVLEGGDAWIE